MRTRVKIANGRAKMSNSREGVQRVVKVFNVKTERRAKNKRSKTIRNQEEKVN